jgi:hypothetical protein
VRAAAGSIASSDRRGSSPDPGWERRRRRCARCRWGSRDRRCRRRGPSDRCSLQQLPLEPPDGTSDSSDESEPVETMHAR